MRFFRDSARLRAASIALISSVWLVACEQGPSSQADIRVNTNPLVTNHPHSETYQSRCAGCHGVNAQGIAEQGTPALTTLQDWYVERQLRHFRDGIRGNHPEDEAGQIMSAAASTLGNDAIAGLVDYLEQLPAVQPNVSSDANLKRGADYHNNLCAACHASDGRGNSALQAPALVGLSAKYIVAQYEKFRAGERGAHPEDQFGVQMRRFAPAVEDPDVVHDIAAYLTTLPVNAD